MIIKYLGELKRYKSLKETPLSEPLKKNQDIVIEFDDSKNLYSHLKTAFLYRKNWTKSWKIMTPDEVMSRSFAKEDDLRKDLYRTDLLIILATAFPFYEAAGKQHEYVIKTRQSLGKATWFCTDDVKGLFDRTDLKSMTTEFKNLMNSQKRIRITKQSTIRLLKEVKNNTKEDTVMELGTSVSEINKDLLDFEDKVWNRIVNYK